jgi:PhnB protein
MSQVTLNPYIFFQGNASDAMEFYKTVFGGELSVQKMGEVPADVPKMEGSNDNMVMHAMLEGGDIKLFASDSPKASPEAKKVSLSLGGTDEAKLRKIFDSLADGGKVLMPLEKQFWGDTFGSLTDKFGVEWMMNISTKKA